jgi:tetratricopeptide (TPR) repeat protein
MTSNANSDHVGDDFERAAADLETRLAHGDLGPDIVREAISVFGELGRGEDILALLARYLDRPLAAEEEAWARWEMVDQLVRLDRCDDAVEAQLELLTWAREALPAERPLWVWAEERHALCWLAVGRHEEWLRRFTQLHDRAVPTPANRLDRLRLLRSAGVILSHLGRHEAALEVARTMRQVADEESGWDWAFWAWTESRIVQLHAYEASGARETLRRAAIAVTGLLDNQHALLRSGQPAAADAVMLRALYQDAAVPLYRAQEYALVIPLLERAVELGSTAPQVVESLAQARAHLEE